VTLTICKSNLDLDNVEVRRRSAVNWRHTAVPLLKSCHLPYHFGDNNVIVVIDFFVSFRMTINESETGLFHPHTSPRAPSSRPRLYTSFSRRTTFLYLHDAACIVILIIIIIMKFISVVNTTDTIADNLPHTASFTVNFSLRICSIAFRLFTMSAT